MASLGTEVHWAGPGLGKGPPRRRWAWVEEKAAEGRSVPGSGDERPLPDTARPKLLEDVHRAQRHPLPLEWGPAPQEAGGTSGEDTEAEDADSPESSPLPLPWLPRQGEPLDLTEEEPNEAPRSPEVEVAGESSRRLGCEATVPSEDEGDTSPMALGWGQARDWVAASNPAGGNELSEHPEVHPAAELGLARSWGSETMSLSHPSDSLDSTWEGETQVPQPTALAEALPQNPHYPLLHAEDRTGGSVARATPTEFQASSISPTQGLQGPAGAWGRETTSLSSSPRENQAWKQTKTSPCPLPSRFTGSISPTNPRSKLAGKDRSETRQGATLAGHSSSDAPKYGRGRLNYPLPDFSKVGPRVRFPKDESYRPPKSRSHSRQPQGPTGPLIFKSPAEIVQEVLLSGGEASLAKDPPNHPITRVPQEFQTPEQATELVHQLQEDYRKLLTKYAEAENTIDQLRLGAKVNLYSDPPQPSHGIHMGMVPQGTKVLSFTIPQPRSAEWQPSPAQDLRASAAAGWPSVQGDLSPSLPPSKPTPGWALESRGIATDQPSAEWTQALASRATQLLAKVQSFEGLMQTGCLTPRDQLQGLQRLRAAHAALEQEYLQACTKQPLTPQCPSSKGTPGDFDPCRELGAELDHLGIRLDQLKDHLDQTQQELEHSGPDLALPVPPGQAPSPASQATQPKPSSPAGPCPLPVTAGARPGSPEVADGAQALPARLQDQELQVELGFHGLLERYLSVKSLPEALRVEEEEEEDLEEDEEQEGEEHHGTPEVDGAALALGKAEATRLPRGQHLARAERRHRAPPQEAEEQTVPVKPPGFQTPMARVGYMPSLGKAEAAPLGPRGPPDALGTKSMASHQSSMTSLEGSGTSEHLPRKSPRHAGRPHGEEPWMASPETDSGFVGSETSRVSPLTQTPEHRLSHTSTTGMSAQHFNAPVPRDGASQPKARGPEFPRRAAEPSTLRRRAQRHLASQSSPLHQGTPSFRLERALAAEIAVPGPELEGRKRISEQLLHSRTISPAPTLTPAAALQPDSPAETTTNLLLSRTGRDQAIRELQAEVSRLRLRLEDSLHRPSQGSLTYPASTFDHPARTRTRDQSADCSATWGSRCGSKSTERLSGEPEGPEQVGPTGRRRARSSSVPREVPRLSLSSESEPPSPRLSSETSRATKDHPQAAQQGTRRAGSSRRPDRVSFRGQYTGQEYHIPSPKAVPRDSGTASCPRCQPVRTPDTGDAATRDPPGPSAADTLHCPMCGRARSLAEEEGSGSAPSGAEKASSRRSAPSTSSPRQKSRRAGSPPRPPPGLWYLAAMAPAPAPPAFAYISSVPVMPYAPASVYYAPPAPTSAPTASPRPARRHRHSIQLDPDALEELQEALSQAVQAAENVCSTSRQMRRTLSADLCQARGMRGSCLF